MNPYVISDNVYAAFLPLRKPCRPLGEMHTMLINKWRKME